MKIYQLHAELNIGFKKIVEYGKILGIEIKKPFQEIQFEHASQIRSLHYKSLNKVVPIHKNGISNSHYSEYAKSNPFELSTIELLQSSNLFDGRKVKLLFWKEKQIKTIFTDFEASSICGGFTDPHLQSLRKYHKQTASQDEVYELHYYAYEAYIKYGGETLTWLLTLPKLPFKAFDATSIFSELDNRRRKINSPIIRLLFTNNDNNAEKMQLSFYSEDTIKGRIINENIIQVKNQTTGKVVFRKITREGIVTPESNAKNIIPILNLFVHFSKDTTKMIINYGLETGECSICGRQLNTADSIKRGVGPVCMKN